MYFLFYNIIFNYCFKIKWLRNLQLYLPSITEIVTGEKPKTTQATDEATARPTPMGFLDRNKKRIFNPNEPQKKKEKEPLFLLF